VGVGTFVCHPVSHVDGSRIIRKEFDPCFDNAFGGNGTSSAASLVVGVPFEVTGFDVQNVILKGMGKGSVYVVVLV
jgi:hypothetical protein